MITTAEKKAVQLAAQNLKQWGIPDAVHASKKNIKERVI